MFSNNGKKLEYAERTHVSTGEQKNSSQFRFEPGTFFLCLSLQHRAAHDYTFICLSSIWWLIFFSFSLDLMARTDACRNGPAHKRPTSFSKEGKMESNIIIVLFFRFCFGGIYSKVQSPKLWWVTRISFHNVCPKLHRSIQLPIIVLLQVAVKQDRCARGQMDVCCIKRGL